MAPSEENTIKSPRRTLTLLRLSQPHLAPQGMDPPAEQGTRRKPGRPTGKEKVSNSPKTLTGAGTSRKDHGINKDCGKQNPVSTNSDNQPLCNMIPATSKRKKADFQNPSTHAGGLALLWKQEINLEVLDANPNLFDTCIELEDAPWFITGDFNDLLSNDEKEGGPQRPEGSFSDMRIFFAEGDIFDLQHSGDSLSWRGQRGEHFVCCRLDRAAANTSWAENFPIASCVYLAYEGSNHKPLISIFEPGKNRRPCIFRYDRRLKDNIEVTNLIRSAWAEATSQPISEHIKLVWGVISRWNKEQQVNSRLMIDRKRRELEEAQSSRENNIQFIHQITKELNKAEEAYWRQRSRLLWLQLGDRNSGFFPRSHKEPEESQCICSN
ncbi:hypothetical protein N665_0925s0008 [Sinapis alba]|nr:hypothetical protein N665_0925s0008 [Sinapis alba]